MALAYSCKSDIARTPWSRTGWRVSIPTLLCTRQTTLFAQQISQISQIFTESTKSMQTQPIIQFNVNVVGVWFHANNNESLFMATGISSDRVSWELWKWGTDHSWMVFRRNCFYRLKIKRKTSFTSILRGITWSIEPRCLFYFVPVIVSASLPCEKFTKNLNCKLASNQ